MSYFNKNMQYILQENSLQQPNAKEFACPQADPPTYKNSSVNSELHKCIGFDIICQTLLYYTNKNIQ